MHAINLVGIHRANSYLICVLTTTYYYVYGNYHANFGEQAFRRRCHSRGWMQLAGLAGAAVLVFTAAQTIFLDIKWGIYLLSL